MMKWLVLLLLAQLSDQQIYDTYRFRETPVGNIAFNDDLTYMAITNTHTLSQDQRKSTISGQTATLFSFL